jgi:dynein heavy chain
VVPVMLNFSAQTTSQRTQAIIEGKLEKKRKTLLGAPVGKKVVIFVDDVNMPKLETYGASPPVELLRQFQDFAGFYDREQLFWKAIQDVTLIAACAPPGGGRNPITPRLLRHFAMLSMPSPDEKTLKAIFTQIAAGFFETAGFSKPIVRAADAIVNAAVGIYERMRTDLLPTPAKSHYVFNLRDLSKCLQGILQADASTFREVDQIFDLFCHETMRVFHDRLINLEDKGFFTQILAEMSYKHFSKVGPPLLLLLPPPRATCSLLRCLLPLHCTASAKAKTKRPREMWGGMERPVRRTDPGTGSVCSLSIRRRSPSRRRCLVTS